MDVKTRKNKVSQINSKISETEKADDFCEKIRQRIKKINRNGDNNHITGVFYALHEHRISVGKATEVIRNFLETGSVDTFELPRGTDECEITEMELRREITAYRAGLRVLAEKIRAGQTDQALEMISRWHLNTPDIKEIKNENRAGN